MITSPFIFIQSSHPIPGFLSSTKFLGLGRILVLIFIFVMTSVLILVNLIHHNIRLLLITIFLMELGNTYCVETWNTFIKFVPFGNPAVFIEHDGDDAHEVSCGGLRGVVTIRTLIY